MIRPTPPRGHRLHEVLRRGAGVAFLPGLPGAALGYALAPAEGGWESALDLGTDDLAARRWLAAPERKSR